MKTETGCFGQSSIDLRGILERDFRHLLVVLDAYVE
jgi:hypothetical protein